MRIAEGILLVTRHGVTEKKQLERGLRALDPNKVIGALLNSSHASSYSSYYYKSPTAS
jgi:Mrp family chromosome partitioning ATPase